MQCNGDNFTSSMADKNNGPADVVVQSSGLCKQGSDSKTTLDDESINVDNKSVVVPQCNGTHWGPISPSRSPARRRRPS